MQSSGKSKDLTPSCSNFTVEKKFHGVHKSVDLEKPNEKKELTKEHWKNYLLEQLTESML